MGDSDIFLEKIAQTLTLLLIDSQKRNQLIAEVVIKTVSENTKLILNQEQKQEILVFELLSYYCATNSACLSLDLSPLLFDKIMSVFFNNFTHSFFDTRIEKEDFFELLNQRMEIYVPILNSIIGEQENSFLLGKTLADFILDENSDIKNTFSVFVVKHFWETTSTHINFIKDIVLYNKSIYNWEKDN